MIYRRRRYRRRYYYGKRVRYSSETYANTQIYALNGTLPAADSSPDDWPPAGYKSGQNIFFPSITIVGATQNQGIRKVKNFGINIAPQINNREDVDPVFKLAWALVYVPERVATSSILPNVNGSMYEPNQNVIACGLADPRQNNRYYTRLARNLNSGDRIMFVCVAFTNETQEDQPLDARLMLTVNYAICYN